MNDQYLNLLAKEIYGSLQRDLLRYARAIYFDLFEWYIHKK